MCIHRVFDDQEWTICFLKKKRKKEKHDAVLCSMSLKAVSTSVIATFSATVIIISL